MTPEELRRAEAAARQGISLIISDIQPQDVPPDLRAPDKLYTPPKAQQDPWPIQRFEPQFTGEFIAVQDMATGQGHTYFGEAGKRKPGELPPRDDPRWQPPLSPKVPPPTTKTTGPIPDPDDHQIEFLTYEIPPGTVLELKPLWDKLAGDDDTLRYRQEKSGASFAKAKEGAGYLTLKVLEFLDGQPFNNLVMAYIQALRPSKVRIVADGCVQLDCMTWRVTVFLKRYGLFKLGRSVSESTSLTPKATWFVDYIEQEVEVGYACGADIEHFLRMQQAGKRPPEQQTTGGCIGNLQGLERVDFS